MSVMRVRHQGKGRGPHLTQRRPLPAPPASSPSSSVSSSCTANVRRAAEGPQASRAALLRRTPRRAGASVPASASASSSAASDAAADLELLREHSAGATSSSSSSLVSSSPMESGGQLVQYSPTDTTTVRFRLRYGTRFGQHLRVVGGHDRLGWWIITDALKMEWSDGDVWIGEVDLPKGGVYEYKYILCEDFGEFGGAGVVAVDWQRGNNQVLALRYDDTDTLEVSDVWDGDPSRSNTESPDGLTLTRENRLAAWVADVEREIAAGREEIQGLKAELEEARKELAFLKSRGGGSWRAEHAAAKEEANAARAAYKVEAAAREELQKKVSALASEREILVKRNDELQNQLKTSTQMFHQALGTCRKLLSMEGDDDGDDGSAADATESMVMPNGNGMNGDVPVTEGKEA